MDAVSIIGEVSLLWRDTDRYDGDVVLFSLDTDEPLALNTFEVAGALATLAEKRGVEEGVRVRVDCRWETVEVVNVDTGETSDGARAVVIDVVVLTDARRP